MKKIYEFKVEHEDNTRYFVEVARVPGGNGNLVKATVSKKKKFFRLFSIFDTHYWADDFNYNLEAIAESAINYYFLTKYKERKIEKVWERA